MSVGILLSVLILCLKSSTEESLSDTESKQLNNEDEIDHIEVESHVP